MATRVGREAKGKSGTQGYVFALHTVLMVSTKHAIVYECTEAIGVERCMFDIRAYVCTLYRILSPVHCALL